MMIVMGNEGSFLSVYLLMCNELHEPKALVNKMKELFTLSAASHTLQTFTGKNGESRDTRIRT